jgi:cation diffusion facilitator family transporter
MNVSPARACAHDPADEAVSPSERRTWWAVGITLLMMVAELVVGTWSRSLALTADGWHMATHAGALALSGLAWWYARSHARSGRYSFGTGKVHALAGYTNALALLAVAAQMVIESVSRLLRPQPIRYEEALAVAVLGLAVNLASARLLSPDDTHAHHDHHDHAHAHHDHHGGAKNLRAAYLHVLADALTSVFAIAALLLGRSFGWAFLDPLSAIVGSALIARWGVGLVRETAGPLLDAVPSTEAWRAIREDLEATGAHVLDLHLWEIADGQWSCVVTLRADAPLAVEDYRARVRARGPITHLTIEIVAG